MLLFLLLALIPQLCLAAFDKNSHDNVVAYWGSGSNQERLGAYCERKNIDVVMIAFLNYVTVDHIEGNFGNACGGPNQYCPQIETDIIKCQQLGIKVLLSIGGGNNVTFLVNSTDEGQKAAKTMYDTFHPQGAAKIKPFGKAEIDGFDIDLEFWGGCQNKLSSNHDGQISLYKNLRSIWTTKTLLLSAAPQCVYPDNLVGDLIVSQEANVDIVFVQFYSSYSCFISNDGFADSLKQWETLFTTELKDRNAMLYPGIQGYPENYYPANGYSVYYSPLKTVYEKLASTRGSSFLGGFGLFDVTGATEHIDILPGADTAMKYIDAFYDFAKGYTSDAVTETTAWTGKSTTTSTESYNSIVLTKTVYVKTPGTITSSLTTSTSSQLKISTTDTQNYKTSISTFSTSTSESSISTSKPSTSILTSFISISKSSNSTLTSGSFGFAKSSSSGESDKISFSAGSMTISASIGSYETSSLVELRGYNTNTSALVATKDFNFLMTTNSTSLSTKLAEATNLANNNETIAGIERQSSTGFKPTKSIASNNTLSGNTQVANEVLITGQSADKTITVGSSLPVHAHTSSTTYATFLIPSNNLSDSQIVIQAVTVLNEKQETIVHTATIIGTGLQTLDAVALTLYKAEYSSDGKIITTEGTLESTYSTFAQSSTIQKAFQKESKNTLTISSELDTRNTIVTNYIEALSSFGSKVTQSTIKSTIRNSTLSSNSHSSTGATKKAAQANANSSDLFIKNGGTKNSLIIFFNFSVCTLIWLVFI